MLNHNAVVAVDEEGTNEYLLIGRGIGFGKKISERVETGPEVNIYSLKPASERGDAREIVRHVNPECLELAGEILDEAQNATIPQMKMFLTRMGDNSKVFVTGDPTQVDLPKKTESGLMHSVSILYKIDDIGFMQLEADDVVRNHLVKQIVKAYEHEKQYE